MVIVRGVLLLRRTIVYARVFGRGRAVEQIFGGRDGDALLVLPLLVESIEDVAWQVRVGHVIEAYEADGAVLGGVRSRLIAYFVVVLSF